MLCIEPILPPGCTGQCASMAGPASSVRLAPELGWWAYLEPGDSDMRSQSRLGIFCVSISAKINPYRVRSNQNRQKVPSQPCDRTTQCPVRLLLRSPSFVHSVAGNLDPRRPTGVVLFPVRSRVHQDFYFPPSLSQERFLCHRTVVMAVTKSWKNSTCQYPAG